LIANPHGQSIADSTGRLYSTDTAAGEVWLRVRNGKKMLLDSGLKAPTAVTLSPDGLWLAVAESHSHWGYSYRVQADGTVDDKQRYYWFHVPDTSEDSGVRAWVPDLAGHLYAATAMGIQIFDRNGRVRALLPVPGGAALGVRFGGAQGDVLYVAGADHKTYRRRLKIAGFPPGAPPVAVPDEGGA